MMMNNPDAAAAAGPWWWCCDNDDNAGEATAAAAPVPTTGESGSFFADVVADHYSTDELFELVWEGQAGGGASGSMQPAVSCLWSPTFSSKPPDVRFDPPSDDEVAAWLGAIVKGDELACDDDDGGRRPVAGLADDGRQDVVPPATMGASTSTERNKKEKVPTIITTDGMMGNKEMRKAPASAGSSRRSHYGAAHNLTEKKRRHKINERLKILQQLVPGCNKSNQASTLDQTIHYMKSLQHQVQAMSVGLAPAVYPVVQQQCLPPGTPVTMPFPAAPTMVLGGHPPSTMVPFGTAMLQLPHYPATAVMMPAAAAVAPLYPAPAAAPTTITAVAPGDAMSANRLHGSSSRSSSKGKGSSSLCVPE